MKTKEWKNYLRRNFVRLSHVWIRRMPGKIILVSKLTADKWRLLQFPLTYKDDDK